MDRVLHGCPPDFRHGVYHLGTIVAIFYLVFQLLIRCGSPPFARVRLARAHRPKARMPIRIPTLLSRSHRHGTKSKISHTNDMKIASLMPWWPSSSAATV